MDRLPKALVTGAEEHQGLAVIRGLGKMGVPVVAAGSRKKSIGFYSKFTSESRVYASPLSDLDRFRKDILRIIEDTGAEVILPAIESTVVAMDAFRDQIEGSAVLATPRSDLLELVVDKLKTANLAREAGVPIPSTIHGKTREEIIASAGNARFPVAIKPRGSSLHAATSHKLGFKVQYANSLDELTRFLQSLDVNQGLPLVQEYVAGVGVCVATVCDHGEPLAFFPYIREREMPITGGISVVRRSLPEHPVLREHVERLVRRLGWHGVAMIEFKWEESTGRYTLMEINGRFQASTALALDAGVNLPWLVYSLHLGRGPKAIERYQIGLRERYMRGDCIALLEYILGDTIGESARIRESVLPSRWRILGRFLWDFRPGVRYDEFKVYDPLPGLVEIPGVVRHVMARLKAIAVRRLRRARRRH